MLLRPYQERIASVALKQNTLVVLPTGLGKTLIAIEVAKKRLELGKVLVLAPTRPLVEQHQKSFSQVLQVQGEIMTGLTPAGKRAYQERLIFATPQTVKNDLEAGRLRLDDFSLLVFDEAHHAIGGYAYPWIAKKYMETAQNPLILALTASPGAEREKIELICQNLFIQHVELRDERHHDIRPWVKPKWFEWIEVELPESFREIKQLLEEAYEERIEKLKQAGVLSKKPKKAELLKVQQELARLKRYQPLRLVAEAIRLEHAIGLIETQSVRMLSSYLERQPGLLRDPRVLKALWLAGKLRERGARHPKLARLCELISQNLKPDLRIIVFANYREMVREIAEVLSRIPGAKPVEFVGQKELRQKEQLERLEQFRSGDFNILVATSIGEEGLDIADAGLAVFYDSVPSPLRTIQRRGRVGRTQPGRIVFLLAKRTRDEAYYWSAKRKERRMKQILERLSRPGLERFI